MSFLGKTLGWLIGRRLERGRPEARYRVALTESEIAATSPGGESWQVRRDALAAVLIETNDSGPWGDDVWWLIVEDSGATCAFPQGATGQQAAIDWLMSLPGFDYRAMMAAMSSAENASFVCWRKDRAGEG